MNNKVISILMGVSLVVASATVIAQKMDAPASTDGVTVTNGSDYAITALFTASNCSQSFGDLSGVCYKKDLAKGESYRYTFDTNALNRQVRFALTPSSVQASKFSKTARALWNKNLGRSLAFLRPSEVRPSNRDLYLLDRNNSCAKDLVTGSGWYTLRLARVNLIEISSARYFYVDCSLD